VAGGCHNNAAVFHEAASGCEEEKEQEQEKEKAQAANPGCKATEHAAKPRSQCIV
jgi:hypothetical protein